MKTANNPSINIALSGWPGSGATTLALLLTLILQKKFIYLGQLFRDLGELMGYENDGESRVVFDNFIEQPFLIVFSLAAAFLLFPVLTLLSLPFLIGLFYPIWRSARRVRKHGKGRLRQVGRLVTGCASCRARAGHRTRSASMSPAKKSTRRNS